MTTSQTDIPLVCPIEPYELDKQMRFGMSDLASRVAASCAAHGIGKDLLLRVYMAGIYHGVELVKTRGEA
jgi:hypothetical protein